MSVTSVEITLDHGVLLQTIGGMYSSFRRFAPSIWNRHLYSEIHLRANLHEVCIGRILPTRFDSLFSIENKDLRYRHVRVLDSPSSNRMCQVLEALSSDREGVENTLFRHPKYHRVLDYDQHED